MPNITVTVDEPVYRRARIAAALHNTTVTQLVRQFLVVLDRQAAQILSPDRSGPPESQGVKAMEPDPFLQSRNHQPKTK